MLNSNIHSRYTFRITNANSFESTAYKSRNKETRIKCYVLFKYSNGVQVIMMAQYLHPSIPDNMPMWDLYGLYGQLGTRKFCLQVPCWLHMWMAVMGAGWVKPGPHLGCSRQSGPRWTLRLSEINKMNSYDRAHLGNNWVLLKTCTKTHSKPLLTWNPPSSYSTHVCPTWTCCLGSFNNNNKKKNKYF